MKELTVRLDDDLYRLAVDHMRQRRNVPDSQVDEEVAEEIVVYAACWLGHLAALAGEKK
jgi:hypothetical protein